MRNLVQKVEKSNVAIEFAFLLRLFHQLLVNCSVLSKNF